MALVTQPTPARSEKNFLIGLILLSVLFAALPYLVGVLGTPAGGSYLGYQYNTDDHMVYAAWMRQAMDGQYADGALGSAAVHGPFNKVLTATHRQNLLVPPRAHRSFPLAELV